MDLHAVFVGDCFLVLLLYNQHVLRLWLSSCQALPPSALCIFYTLLVQLQNALSCCPPCVQARRSLHACATLVDAQVIARMEVGQWPCPRAASDGCRQISCSA